MYINKPLGVNFILKKFAEYFIKMLKKFVFLISAIFICSTLADYESDYKSLILQINSDPKLHEDYDRTVEYATSLDPNYMNYTPTVKINCKTISSINKIKHAENVHELKPSDIKVIAALGDSITAGIGLKALTPLGLLIEFRGED